MQTNEYESVPITNISFAKRGSRSDLAHRPELANLCLGQFNQWNVKKQTKTNVCKAKLRLSIQQIYFE